MIFPYDPKAVLDLTAELDRWKTLLDYRGPLRRAWAGRLRRDLEAEAVVLAGTDLFLAFEGRACGFPTIDSARVHIDALCRESMKHPPAEA